jgi:hypothetical protein
LWNFNRLAVALSFAFARFHPLTLDLGGKSGGKFVTQRIGG